MNDGDKYSPRNDQDLREILRIFVSNKNFKFNSFIETPSKPFSEWTFPKVCQLYSLSDDLSPSINVYPVFSCGCIELNDEKSRTAVKNLMTELKLRIKTTPLDMAYEAIKSIYSYFYLASGVSFYEEDFKIIPEKTYPIKNKCPENVNENIRKLSRMNLACPEIVRKMSIFCYKFDI
ncbi:unnamed protein product [Rhizophagus irregularis]|nr:unnamed protein product [Rhizophagus irregularis]